MEENVGAAEGTGAFKCPKCGGTWRYIHNYRYCLSCGTKIGRK